ncbi:MAG: universal stress protein [Oscillochloridaceae bacterium]|nr:universal stress protein [Chloroflexaceae bacterium]MDW8390842.1 universal stress protein [Oscillochloridaceae bacterium]
MQTILVPLDGSPFGEHALPMAVTLARRGNIQIALAHVHHLFAPSLAPTGAPVVDPRVDAVLREDEEAYLADVARRIATLWNGPVTMTLLEAPVAEALCQHADLIGASLIVMSTHGRGGLARAWLGSVADRMIRLSKTPILLLHPEDGTPDLAREPKLHHFLVPLDGSPLSEQILPHATWLGRLVGARYTLLRVIEPAVRGFAVSGVEPMVDVEAQEQAWQQATADLERIATRLRGEGLTVAPEVRVGRPIAEILECAAEREVDLIAMSTHGHGGLTRLLLGSVTDKVLRSAGVPVLVFRPPEAR